MTDAPVDLQSRREAVQPSLWDRLVDDLPGVVAEADALASELAETVGGREALDRLLQEGPRGVERRKDLPEATRERLHLLLSRGEERRMLEERGIVVTPTELRKAVRRDIEALFSVERLESRFLLTDAEAARYESPDQTLADFPEVRRSVLNYGVPAFAGLTGSDFDKDRLARDLRDALAVFEPRLKRDTVRVDVRFGDGLMIEIEAVLMVTPVPERLRLSTTIDLNTGVAKTEVEEA